MANRRVVVNVPQWIVVAECIEIIHCASLVVWSAIVVEVQTLHILPIDGIRSVGEVARGGVGIGGRGLVGIKVDGTLELAATREHVVGIGR